MYPDSAAHGPYDDLDPAARREFFSEAGRRAPHAEEPTITPAQGNLADKAITPDPTSDHQFSRGAEDRH
jgi:hypothetical protein